MGAFTVSVYAVAISDGEPSIDYDIMNAFLIILNTSTFNLTFITPQENDKKFTHVDEYLRDGEDIPREVKNTMIVAFTRIFAFLRSEGLYDHVYEVNENGEEDKETIAIDLTRDYGGVTLRQHLINLFTLMRSLYNINTKDEEKAEREEKEEGEREAKRRKVTK